MSTINPSKIIGIQFSILSPQEIRKGSVAQITTRDTYINNKPVINGLFDPRMGVLDPGLICPTDGLDYMKTPGYFGHIELARPVFYIQYLNTLIKILRCICIKCSKLKICKEKFSYLLEKKHKKRWDAVFKLASKVSRCGEETECGCGTKQPNKIFKDGLATIFAEWANLEGVLDEEGNTKEKMVMKLTPEIVLKIFRRISDEDVAFMGFSPIWSRPDWMICQVLAVPPPAVRPSVKHDAQQRSEDDISHIIVNIIKSNKTLQEKIKQNATAKVIDDWTTVLQYYCATMIDNKIPGCAPVAQRSGRALKSIKERLIGKSGRVRGNLMGKRVDFSARSVITPDPQLSIRELGVPKPIAKNITYPECVNDRNKQYLTKLMQNGPDVWPGAKILQRKSGENISLRYVDRHSIELENGDILHRHMQDGDIVLFNRQPTLHRMSMMAHYTKVMEKGNTFRMNVGDTKPYNADFDGDEMNMHMAQNDEAKVELIGLAAVSRQIISPANNSSIIGIFQDSLLGANRFTRGGVEFTKRDAMNLLMGINNINVQSFKHKRKEKITNFDLLSQIIPPLSAKFKNRSFADNESKKESNNIIEIKNGTYIRGQMDKSTFGGSNGLIQSIFNDFGFEASAKFIDDLQKIVTEYMKTSAYSVGISDLIANIKTNNAIIAAITKKKKDVKKLINQTHIGIFENNTGKTNKEEFETRVNAILNKAQEEAGKIGRKSLSRNNRFVTMVNAGSKGNNINIAQMISCLGQQNVDGKRIPYGFDQRTLPHFNKFDDSPEARGFVENSFIQGLTPQELYFHAMGGRVGLIDTAVKTSQTGYIQRRLVKGLEDLQVKYDMTVRNNKSKIIQFKYGNDAIDTTKVETQYLPITRKNIEEIYAHFQISNDTFEDEKYTVNYTKRAKARIVKQKAQLIEKTKEIIEYILEMRDKVMKNIFNFEDNTRIHLPVKFSRIINNIQHQMNIQTDSMVNITPYELYIKLDKTLEILNQYNYAKPTELFKVMLIYSLSPREILMVRRFNKKAVEILLETIILNYKRAIVHPGEMVGIIAAQSIGEPTTQLTLNTFHFAGVASKSNVTRGVPRIEEILSLSENPKNPSLTIYLKKEDETSKQKARELMHILEYTILRDVTKSISIYFDPDDLSTLITKDKILMEEYKEFTKMMNECADTEEKSTKKSKWILRLELDKETLLDKNITMDDVYFALRNTYKDNVSCIYNDLNADELIMRIRLDKSLTTKKIKSLDQNDKIYLLKNIQENILNNTVLRGIKGIDKVIIRKVPNRVVLKNGNYINEEGWVLDTIGTNLKGVLALDYIDKQRTFSNHIKEISRTFGIEAARQSIFNELTEVLEFDGTYINYHHLELLCDRMTGAKKLCSIFRHGINNDDIGPVAKASFEETPEMFLRAAKHAELDEMRGISANVMCGQKGYYGTSAFEILLDMGEIKKLTEKELDKKIDTEEILTIENPNDMCSTQNLTITNTTETIQKTDLGTVDDEYDPGF